MSQHDESPRDAAIDAASMMKHLDSGTLADLRRMEPGREAAGFWKLVARHPATIGNPNREAEWMRIIRILAILTPKGKPGNRGSLHDGKRRLGHVLCDGGDPNWPGTAPSGPPRPVFSEHRLATLLAARGQHRAVLLTRAARAIARSIPPDAGVNVWDIARALLFPGDNRQIAEHYYRRLDKAASAQSEEGPSP